MFALAGVVVAALIPIILAGIKMSTIVATNLGRLRLGSLIARRHSLSHVCFGAQILPLKKTQLELILIRKGNDIHQEERVSIGYYHLLIIWMSGVL